MAEQQNKTRKIWLDAAKGIGMIAIVMGHMGNSVINKFVFTFHVPIFLIISGLFFSCKDGLIGKRFKQLIKPYLSTCLLLLLLGELKMLLKVVLGRAKLWELLRYLRDILLSTVYGSGSREEFLSFHFKYIGAIWYFLALMWATVFLWTILRYIKNMVYRSLVVLILFITGYLSAMLIWLPFSIQAGMSSTLFLYLGYVYKENELAIKKISNIKLYAMLLSIIVWGFSLFFSYSNSLMAIVRSYFPNPIINIFGACGASYLIILLCLSLSNLNSVQNSKAYKWICYIGKYSLVFMCFHLIELTFVPWRILYQLTVPEIIVLLLILCCKLVYGTLCVYTVNRFEVIKKLFI